MWLQPGGRWAGPARIIWSSTKPVTRQLIGDPYSLLDLSIAPIWVRIFSACAELCPPENGSIFWKSKAAGSVNRQSFVQSELRRLFTNGLILPRANEYHKTMSQRPVLLANYSTPLI